MAQSSQYNDLRGMMDDIREKLTRLDGRLDVHDQKHVALDREHAQFAETLKVQGEKLVVVENLSVQNERDLAKLTSNLSKLTWAFATPLIGLIVIALIIMAATVAK